MPILSASLTTLELFNIPSLVGLPFSVKNLNKLEKLKIWYCMGLESLPTGINLKSLDTLSLVGCSRLKNFPDISTNISELHLDKTGIVEVPWWIEKLSRLKWLDMSECINLEILPTRINLQSLSILDLSGCLRLRIFPDISTNISRLDLSRTGIKEVPWWIEKFSHLYSLEMNGCNSLQRVFLNIFKLKHLQRVDFSHCWALVGADLTGLPSGVYAYFPKVNLNFLNCFSLDQEALIHQHSVFFKSMILSGEEVSPYFIHRTNGTTSSLKNIPLLHTHLSKPFFRFRACAVVTFDPMPRNHANEVEIHVNCRFKGIFGNVFDSFGQPHMFFTTDHQDSHVFILECHIPLNKDITQLNFDHVDMQLHVTAVNDSKFKVKGWGIRLISEDFSLPENQLCNPNTLTDVCEAEEENIGYTSLQGLVNETEGEESGDSNAETERSRKRMRIYYNFI
ncbi:unnamed protein product [Microthlaspi erraticum]|uniref:Uncharacterized protein n=1 Tax=Microthlaspi erraticum TaxID=1685480 RepID=A0A6D2IZR5_9BRAS|nr:unnamed protein product [Microthlaspi erraticum]